MFARTTSVQAIIVRVRVSIFGTLAKSRTWAVSLLEFSKKIKKFQNHHELDHTFFT